MSESLWVRIKGQANRAGVIVRVYYMWSEEFYTRIFVDTQEIVLHCGF